jgi:hypothetical protein
MLRGGQIHHFCLEYPPEGFICSFLAPAHKVKASLKQTQATEQHGSEPEPEPEPEPDSESDSIKILGSKRTSTSDSLVNEGNRELAM